MYALNALTAFANGVDTAHLDQVLRYRNLHTLRFDVETDITQKITAGGSCNYNSAVLRLDDLFVGKGTWIELVEAVNGGPVIKGLTEYMAEHRKGDWVFDLRLGYNLDPNRFAAWESNFRRYGFWLLYLQLNVQVAELFRLGGSGGHPCLPWSRTSQPGGKNRTHNQAR